MKASTFFTQEWGTVFEKAILSKENILLEISMKDIYDTMDKYVELHSIRKLKQSRTYRCPNCIEIK